MEELKPLVLTTNWTIFCQLFPIFIYLLSSNELKKSRAVIIVLLIIIIGIITDVSFYNDTSVSINLYCIIYTILVLFYFFFTKPQILNKTSLKYVIMFVAIIRVFLLYIDKPYTVNLPFLIFNNILIGALLSYYFLELMKQKENQLLQNLAFWTIFAYWIHTLFYTLLAFRIITILTFDIDWVIIRIIGAFRCVFVCIGFLIEDKKLKTLPI